MTLATCSTCVYWKHPRDEFISAVRYPESVGDESFAAREEEQRLLDIQYGLCRRIQMPPERNFGDVDIPQAVVIDGSEYRADLMSLPTFGCSLWQAEVIA